MFKRIFLFLLINALVIFSVSALLHLFNVKPYLTRYGLDYRALAIFCLIWGVAGSMISLLLSKTMAKWMMGVRIFDKTIADSSLREVYDTVERLQLKANLPCMPEVGVFDSPMPNAFATGPSKRKALVAVSTGLLRTMNSSQIEAIIGHELSHIKNGDMVTMTLIQGIVNAFVMFLARVLAFVFAGNRSDNRRSGGIMSYYMSVFLFEILFMILGSLVVTWFSRRREYRADEGGAQLSSRMNMISALECLQNLQEIPKRDQERPKEAMAALMIASNKKKLFRLFSTHPPLQDRINKLHENIYQDAFSR